MRNVKNKALNNRRLRVVVLRGCAALLSLQKMNIEDVTIGELIELRELSFLDLSSPEQVKRRGELLAKIFGPDTELEAITKKYLDLEVRFMQQAVELYNVREWANRLNAQVTKLSANADQLKQEIQDA